MQHAAQIISIADERAKREKLSEIPRAKSLAELQARIIRALPPRPVDDGGYWVAVAAIEWANAALEVYHREIFASPVGAEVLL